MLNPPYAPNWMLAPPRQSSLPFRPSTAHSGSRIRETGPRSGKAGLNKVTPGGCDAGVGPKKKKLNSGMLAAPTPTLDATRSITCVIGAVGAEISGAACAATGTKVAAAATAIAAVPTLSLVAIVFMDPPAFPPWKSLLASQTRMQP